MVLWVTGSQGWIWGWRMAVLLPKGAHHSPGPWEQQAQTKLYLYLPPLRSLGGTTLRPGGPGKRGLRCKACTFWGCLHSPGHSTVR